MSLACPKATPARVGDSVTGGAGPNTSLPHRVPRARTSLTSWSARVARMGESAGFGTGAGTTSADPAVRPDARAVGFEPRLGPGTAVAKASRAGADAGASTAP